MTQIQKTKRYRMQALKGMLLCTVVTFCQTALGAAAIIGGFDSVDVGTAASNKQYFSNLASLTKNVIIKNYTSGSAVDQKCFINAAGAANTPSAASPYSFVLRYNDPYNGASRTDSFLHTITPKIPSGASSTPSPDISQGVPVAGYYLITLTLKITQGQSYPISFWLDAWATTNTSNQFNVNPLTAPTTDIRLFYTGDVPYQLNSNGVKQTIIFSGGAYLNAGAKIGSPRIWSTQNPDLTYPVFCVNNDTTYTAQLIY